MLFLNHQIEDVLAAHTPKLIDHVGARRAAVALVLSSDVDAADRSPVMLLIKRASHPSDPWSGQLAFPGGRHEPDDRDLVTTARRETCEETGVDLDGPDGVRLLGQLDDIQGRARGKAVDLVISCFVFAMDSPPHITPNYEVADYYWLSLSACCDPERQLQFFPHGQASAPYPGIQVDPQTEDILWGLTYRFTCNFFARFGVKLP